MTSLFIVVTLLILSDVPRLHPTSSVCSQKTDPSLSPYVRHVIVTSHFSLLLSSSGSRLWAGEKGGVVHILQISLPFVLQSGLSSDFCDLLWIHSLVFYQELFLHFVWGSAECALVSGLCVLWTNFCFPIFGKIADLACFILYCW